MNTEDLQYLHDCLNSKDLLFRIRKNNRKKSMRIVAEMVLSKDEATIQITHVISRRNKWAVVRSGAKRALKIFKYREEAYFYARQNSKTVVVHNTNGTVLFVHRH